METRPVVEARNLVKRYQDTVAVNGIDMVLEPGRCYGILGPNGAGKTTTVEMLVGLTPRTSGELTVLGGTWDKDAVSLRKRVAVQLQETRMLDRITVRETLAFFYSFSENPLPIDHVLELVKLTSKRNAFTMNLSGGQRQRLALATVLIGAPELILLDEPTAGLDPNSRMDVWDVVSDLKRNQRTLLLTTHYMEEAERLCDWIFMFDAGKIIAQGTPSDLVSRYGGGSTIELQTEPMLPSDQLRSLPGVVSVAQTASSVRIAVRSLQESLSPIIALAHARGVTLKKVTTSEPDLNDAFLALTRRDTAELPDLRTSAA